MTGDYQTPTRMAAKLAAVPLPDLKGKRVLDVGTDHGFWAFLAAERGAVQVVGLDRNREVRGQGRVDLIALNTREAAERGVSDRVAFQHIDLGRQWHHISLFDVVLVMSVYHHIYQNCGDHRAVWFWLSRQCVPGGELIWEGPVDDGDPVVRANVSEPNRERYRLADILDAASEYFDAQRIGPALHEPTREVWRFRRHPVSKDYYGGVQQSGAGGASKAFLHADGRRMAEIETILGWRPVPGSLNIGLADPFGWRRGYVRAQVLDVMDRAKGLASEWAPRWARLYPMKVDGYDAAAFRFEGERYPDTFVELIAPQRLRDVIAGPEVTLCM